MVWPPSLAFRRASKIPGTKAFRFPVSQQITCRPMVRQNGTDLTESSDKVRPVSQLRRLTRPQRKKLGGFRSRRSQSRRKARRKPPATLLKKEPHRLSPRQPERGGPILLKL